MPLQTNCAAFKFKKADESLAAEFVECLNRTAEIDAAVDPVFVRFFKRSLNPDEFFYSIKKEGTPASFRLKTARSTISLRLFA
jgi:hypothetical protein